MNALLIGCGNIGALYDFDNDKVQTYAKALSLQQGWQVSVFDRNAQLAEKVAGKYGFRILESIEHMRYDLVCIASPTAFHYPYLKQALLENVPVVICEKPVSPELSELEELEQLYKNGNSKVIVNYIRRFQPSYEAIRKMLILPHSQAMLALPPPKGEISITLRYRRGILNNGTHGLDLIEFLTGTQLDFTGAVIRTVEHDAFPNDPTVACSLPQDGFTVELESVAGTESPVFEMELAGDKFRLELPSNGNIIRLYRDEQLVHASENVLDRYMEAVIALPERMLADQQINDNFMESITLNGRVLELMKTL